MTALIRMSNVLGVLLHTRTILKFLSSKKSELERCQEMTLSVVLRRARVAELLDA